MFFGRGSGVGLQLLVMPLQLDDDLVVDVIVDNG
jgi:hypothetical protein